MARASIRVDPRRHAGAGRFRRKGRNRQNWTVPNIDTLAKSVFSHVHEAVDGLFHEYVSGPDLMGLSASFRAIAERAAVVMPVFNPDHTNYHLTDRFRKSTAPCVSSTSSQNSPTGKARISMRSASAKRSR
ncbi:hypothetical protein [Burkholderia sp. F1]|uniref:hypothetical protein n=1 Tax=Burkholderia sp. F1 TaxID=3366817 RepID=UPI003D755638